MAEDIPTKTLTTQVDPAYDEETPASPFAIPNAVLRHRGLIVLMVAVGVAVGLLIGVLQVPQYEAVARFVVSAADVRGVGDGGDLGPLQQRDPFDYYSTVLVSTDVLDAVLATPRPSGGLIKEHLGLPDGGADQAAARRRLSGATVARLDTTRRSALSGSFPVLMVRSVWNEPQMAADLANAFLNALADYDRRIRSAAATARRTFIEEQVGDTFKALTAAEDALREFREENRLVRVVVGGPVPPELGMRNAQLERELELQTELYVALKKALDEVRIAELDDASALVIVEPAAPPRTRTGTARRTFVLAGAVFGLLTGLVLTGIVELRQRADWTSPEAQEFLGHLDAIRRQLLGVTGRLGAGIASPGRDTHPEQKHDA